MIFFYIIFMIIKHLSEYYSQKFYLKKNILYLFIFYLYHILYLHYNNYTIIIIQPQIRKSWDSMENANKKRK